MDIQIAAKSIKNYKKVELGKITRKMNILKYMKKISSEIEQNKNSLFSYPVSRQKKYIEHFPEPKDDIERSYYQYCCQMKLKGSISFMLNIVSLPMLIIYYFKSNSECEDGVKYDAVFFSNGVTESIIPNELRKEYSQWKNLVQSGENLTQKDKHFFKEILRRYPFSWHFLLKNLIKIRFYSYITEHYRPNAIIVCGEYSFTSSLLTAYCEKNKITHINVMHGEKLYYIRDSFFHFHQCYIWNEYYRKIFELLRADTNQFIVKTPPSMKIYNRDHVCKQVNYTYYLAAENRERMEIIAKCMRSLISKGESVAIRPHPIYSDLNLVREIFNDMDIEEELGIEQSILRTEHAISGYSTVLNQAYHSNVKIVVDDVSDYEKYKTLFDARYIMLNVEHQLLSEVIK